MRLKYITTQGAIAPGKGEFKLKLYMAVTADKYELPVIVEEDIRVFAKRLGISLSTAYSETSRTTTDHKRYPREAKGRKIRYYKVIV